MSRGLRRLLVAGWLPRVFVAGDVSARAPHDLRVPAYDRERIAAAAAGSARLAAPAPAADRPGVSAPIHPPIPALDHPGVSAPDLAA
jgi:hypothetical protein